jgi:hypothetical protein
MLFHYSQGVNDKLYKGIFGVLGMAHSYSHKKSDIERVRRYRSETRRLLSPEDRVKYDSHVYAPLNDLYGTNPKVFGDKIKEFLYALQHDFSPEKLFSIFDGKHKVEREVGTLESAMEADHLRCRVSSGVKRQWTPEQRALNEWDHGEPWDLDQKVSRTRSLRHDY